MNMESNHYGADNDDYLRRKAAEKKAMFDEIRKRIIESNSTPYTRDEFLKKSTEIAMRNRLRAEEFKRNQPGGQNPDNAA